MDRKTRNQLISFGGSFTVGLAVLAYQQFFVTPPEIKKLRHFQRIEEMRRQHKRPDGLMDEWSYSEFGDSLTRNGYYEEAIDSYETAQRFSKGMADYSRLIRMCCDALDGDDSAVKAWRKQTTETELPPGPVEVAK